MPINTSDQKIIKYNDPIIHRPVDPVYRIPDLPVDTDFLVDRAMKKFDQFTIDRFNWIDRVEEFYIGFDDYLTPIRRGLWDGSSNLHMPLPEIQCNNMHARILQAVFFSYPWFFIEPQEELDSARIQKIELLMKYILMRYANYNNGIYNAIDDWAWDLSTLGVGIFSRAWCVDQRRAVVVEENREFMAMRRDLIKMLEDTEEKDFAEMSKQILKLPYVEKSIVRTVFNGPIVIAEDPLYVLFKGYVADSTNLDLHETVMKVCYFTPSQLIQFSQSQFFDEDVVNEILATKPVKRNFSTAGSRGAANVERVRDRASGVDTQNAQGDEDVYEFLCVYDKTPLKSTSRICDHLIYFVNTNTRKLARWTFLDRESSTGKLPLHMAHLYRRPRRSLGRGVVETQYSLSEALDMLVNQSIDAGLLANQPMFGYRGGSNFDPGEVRIEPGLGIKCDDPNNDIRFFEWRTNPNWSAGLQSTLLSFAYQSTSLGPLSSGQVGPTVGPLRSAQGVRDVLGQTDVNLDPLVTRAKQCVSALFEGLYYDSMAQMPESLKITVIGEDGIPLRNENGEITYETLNKAEVRGRVHFGIYANSQTMNREGQMRNAQVAAQFLLQPIGLNTGVVRPHNVYAIYDELLRKMGKQQIYKFITKPDDMPAMPIQAELLLIMQGLKPPIILNDPEHQMKIGKFTEIKNSDQAQIESEHGMVNSNAMAVLDWAIGEHQRFLATINRPQNVTNPTGENQSPTLGQQGNNIEINPQAPQEAPGGGGGQGGEEEPPNPEGE